MKLIHNHILVSIWVHLPKFTTIVTLDGTEQVINLLRFRSTHQKVAKVLISKDCSICAEGLPEDLLTVGDKQQRRCSALLTTPATVIERGDHRLAGPSSGHDKVRFFSSHLSLGGDYIEYFLLKRIRPKIKMRE